MKRIITISIALLMLVSNIGFSLNTHFCGGEAVETSFSIGLHSPSCGMENMDKSCEAPKSFEEQLKLKSCCETQHQVIQLDEYTNTQSFIGGVNIGFFVAFAQVFFQPLIFTDQSFVHNSNYFPPTPDKDIQILYQTFLI